MDTPSAPPSPASTKSKVVSRILDAAAVVLILFAVWKIFVAPRFFTSKAKAVAAPAVVLPLMNGGTFALAKARGHVVFLDFWASWCEPCKLSIPLIERYKKAHPDTLVFSVNAGEPVAVAERYARGANMTRVAFDPEMKVSDAFGVTVFPTMIVIDPDGKERAKWIGFNPLIEQAMAGVKF
ncbi:MAG: TlpA family protein disulfide reductase [Candidatus Eremiobacteraeota bacterium]|nr:TlpA family protein disulfide reductase [Candidatus Eremiobacteraeota bacterium]